MTDEAMKADNHEPDYRKAMLFHSDRADQYAAERDAAIARAEAAEAKVKKLRAERDDALTFLDNAVAKAPEPLKALGKYLAGRLDEDEWPTAEQHLNAAAKACADRTTAAEAQIAALAARVEKLRGALADLTAAFAKKVDVNSTRWRMPYEHPLSAYDRAMDLLAASITEADNA